MSAVEESSIINEELSKNGTCTICKNTFTCEYSTFDYWCFVCNIEVCDSCAYEIPKAKVKSRYSYDSDGEVPHSSSCKRPHKSAATIRYCGGCRTRDPIFLAYLLGCARFGSLDEAHKSFYPDLYNETTIKRSKN